MAKGTYLKKPFWRLNQSIRAEKLRVIDSDGKQLGIFSLTEALEKTNERGLDLVEIAPHANPPVAKIIDFAKFRYQEEKKLREAKRREKRGSEQKEVWFTPFIAEGDYTVRLEKVREFLGDGAKVRVVVRFKGRQMAQKGFGYKVLGSVTSDTKDIAGVDQHPKFIGRQAMMVLTPVKKAAEGQESKTDEKQEV